ncbi:ubiquitinyl hydrolase 1 [Ranunculus cassubicifolius]
MVLQDNNFTVVKVARNEDLSEQIGRDIVFDLVNHDKLRCFCIKNQIPFYTFKEAAAKEFGIPVQFQRFWLWAKRENLTYRPHRPLTHEEETQTCSSRVHNLTSLEYGPYGEDSYLIHPPEICKEDILIFFKLYDPAIEKLRYVGRLLVKSTGRPSGILMKLNEMAGFFSSQEIDLYEEIKFEPSVLCEPIEKELTFQASQLENGDIVCFQKSPTVGSGQQYRYPDVPSYLEYVHDRQVPKLFLFFDSMCFSCIICSRVCFQGSKRIIFCSG